MKQPNTNSPIQTFEQDELTEETYSKVLAQIKQLDNKTYVFEVPEENIKVTTYSK